MVFFPQGRASSSICLITRVIKGVPREHASIYTIGPGKANDTNRLIKQQFALLLDILFLVFHFETCVKLKVFDFKNLCLL